MSLREQLAAINLTENQQICGPLRSKTRGIDGRCTARRFLFHIRAKPMGRSPGSAGVAVEV
jgi:hypothetical protein